MVLLLAALSMAYNPHDPKDPVMVVRRLRADSRVLNNSNGNNNNSNKRAFSKQRPEASTRNLETNTPSSTMDPSGSTCAGHCGEGLAGCWCDSVCQNYDDCCDDVCDECGVCAPASTLEPSSFGTTSPDGSVDPSSTLGPTPGGGSGGGNTPCPAGWTEASLTTYTSFPACCSDPNADPAECTDYSGCDYQGQFAFIPEQTEDWVQQNDVCAFATTHGDINTYANQKILIDKWDKTIECNVVDTCADSDCDGCCTENAGESGYLIDMEYWTVQRYYGDGNAYGQACFQLA